jgi:hypothetical protein
MRSPHHNCCFREFDNQPSLSRAGSQAALSNRQRAVARRLAKQQAKLHHPSLFAPVSATPALGQGQAFSRSSAAALSA